MLKFQLMTAQDCKEAAAIERRRRAEAERKKRIFDPRARLIGIDFCALDKQIQERNERIQEEKIEELRFAEQQRRHSEIIIELDKKEKETKKRIAKELNEFRVTYQRAEDRREFDLYDPDGLKKSLPGRISDDDPRLGVSSLQKFVGEDLAFDERAKIQKEQQHSWLSQQIMEKEAAERDRIAAENAYKAAMVARDERAVEIEKLEIECKKRMDEATSKFNAAMAAEQDSNREMEERQTEEDNLADIYNTITSPLLCEDSSQAQSNLGAHRKIARNYKGMSPEEIKAIHDMVARQIEENKHKKAAEKQLEADWNALTMRTAMIVALKDKELLRQKKDFEDKLKCQNLELSMEQKAHKEYMDKCVFTNTPTAAYYEQFNTSTR